MRFSSHWPRTLMRVPQRAAGLRRLLEHLASGQPPAAPDLAQHQSRAQRHDVSQLLVADVGRGRQGSILQARGSRSSRGCRSRPACAGRAARRRPAGSDRRNAAGGGSPASRARRRGCPVPAAQVGVEAQPQSRISSRIGPLYWTTVLGRGLESRAMPCGRGPRRRPSLSGSRPGSNTRQRPDMRRWECTVRSLSKRRKRFLPWVSIDRMRAPASFAGQPSSLWRAGA